MNAWCEIMLLIQQTKLPCHSNLLIWIYLVPNFLTVDFYNTLQRKLFFLTKLSLKHRQTVVFSKSTVDI